MAKVKAYVYVLVSGTSTLLRPGDEVPEGVTITNPDVLDGEPAEDTTERDREEAEKAAAEAAAKEAADKAAAEEAAKQAAADEAAKAAETEEADKAAKAPAKRAPKAATS